MYTFKSTEGILFVKKIIVSKILNTLLSSKINLNNSIVLLKLSKSLLM